MLKSQGSTTIMIDEYFNIYNEKVKEYGEKTVVLMECGTFMEIYELDNKTEKLGNAYKISKILNLNYANKNGDLTCNNRSYPNFVGFTSNCVSKYLPVLIENDYTVVVISQLETSNNKKGKIIKRGVTGVYSKCLQPLDMDIGDNQYNLLYISLEIKDKQNIIKRNSKMEYLLETSICCINNFTNVIEICNKKFIFINDNFESCLNDFDHSLYKFFSKDIHIHFIGESVYKFESRLLNFFDSRYEKLRIHNFDKKRHDQYMKYDYQNEYFKQVYDHINFGLINPVEYLYINDNLSRVNLMYAIDFIGRHDMRYIKNLSLPKMMDDLQHLTLPLDTLTQLNIDKGVFDIINFTRTSIGKRYLKSILCKPFKDVDDIEYRYKLTEELERDLNYSKIDQLLVLIVDFERLHRKMALEVLHPYEFEKLYLSYLSMLSLIDILNENHIFKKILLSYDQYIKFKEYIKQCEEMFNFDILKKYNLNSTKDEISNYFLPKVIPELDEIQLKINNIEKEREDLREYYNNKIENGKLNDYIKISYSESEGYSFSCTKIRYQLLMNALKNEHNHFKIKQTNNITKFFTPELSDLSNRLLSVRELLNNKINIHYINTLKAFYHKHCDIFSSLTLLIQMIDVANSNLKCKNKYNYCRPCIKISRESFFRAEGLRHPIIETMSEKYIPNDIVLDNENVGILLYGLNSSGKSSLLRSIGVSVILAQSGLFVPCSSFTYAPFNTLISQVDLSDNIYTGKSSFITEMIGLKKILDLSGENTLVLADELCRGTETYSAISIVCASILNLIRTNTKFFFTTHLHQIIELPKIKDITTLKICHLSVTIKNTNIIFDRIIKPSSGSPLYGLEVCKSIIDDDTFIDNAFEIRNVITKNKSEIIGFKKSNYNKKKIMNKCEICSCKDFLETHHITFQCTADSDGFLESGIHKNHLSNLSVLCKKCHDDVTYNRIIIHGYKDSINNRFLSWERNEL